MAFYTIGQRKGLGISSPEPVYVISKNTETNSIVVGEKLKLGKSDLYATEVNWISGIPPRAPFNGTVKIRYKANEVSAIINPEGESTVYIRFDNPLRDITPGQAVVFYQDQVCLGGGIIQ